MNYEDRYKIMDKVLALTSRLLPAGQEVWVAGGFIRDTTFVKPVKDLDVFILGATKDTLGYFDKMARPMGVKRVSASRVSNDFSDINYVANPQVLEVFRQEANIFLPYTIDFIFRKEKTVEELLKDFPVSISRCAYSLAYGLHYDEAFMQTRSGKTIWVNKGISPNYLHRIQDKYPTKEGWEYLQGDKDV